MEYLKNKLFSKVEVSASTGCWTWTAGKGIGGYGRVRVGLKTRYAHRVSFEIHRGTIPRGMFVCHSCDNPACLNPDHLFLGTPAENMADRDRKGRQARQRGAQNAMAKLTDAAVLEIKAAVGPQREIADRYGVSRGHISFIRTGRRWAHLN